MDLNTQLGKKLKKRVLEPMRRHRFLFEELVKRDFKHKYKGTALGVFWSVLSPLLHLLVMRVVFTEFFGRNTPHYTTYLFSGLLVYSFYVEATKNGMNAILANANIISKVKVPHEMFLLSKNVSSLINFSLTLCVFFIFCIIDRVTFSWSFFALLYPVACLIVFNIGVGMILSALFVFFRDTAYLYDIFTLLLRYMSAIFYRVDRYPWKYQRLFHLNPVYCYIRYFRIICVDAGFPSLRMHALCAGYALIAFGLGLWIYRSNRTKFLYYI